MSRSPRCAPPGLALQPGFFFRRSFPVAASSLACAASGADKQGCLSLRCRLGFLAIFISLALTGCGGSSDGTQLAAVAGKVTLDGQPLAKATVTFQPDSGAPSVGMTDSSGYYKLEFSTTRSGAIADVKHTVRITTGEKGIVDDKGKTVGGTPEKVPAKYNTNTELTKDVKSGKNTIDFELKSK